MRLFFSLWNFDLTKMSILPLWEHINCVQKNLTEIEIFSSILFRCDLHGLQQASPFKSRKFSDKNPKWTLLFLTGHLLVRLRPRFFLAIRPTKSDRRRLLAWEKRALWIYKHTTNLPIPTEGDTRLQIKVEIIPGTVMLTLDTLLNGLNTCWGHFETSEHITH